ncbi:glycoside hydrolase family 88 protein [Paraglaciecola aquimarina]|uniref:Glycoside hydrolase family 88 protein n=1 Tax=Paraglaciecola aquimarina TaxID=1235557 RepID=A0ABU3SRI4_9ALTE|nr:glycoside hydrolase family 88 protein [Paraglaciecola aquimarina]MDU0352618.1 glycoside hydrolase family 88 protein [Paraglaciecola aquimarina]
MKYKLAICGLAVILAIGGSGCNSTQSGTEHSAVQMSATQKSALEVGHKVAKWQIDHLDNLDYLAKRYHKSSSEPRGWIQAAFYIGLTHWAETVNDKLALQQITKMAKQQNYSLLTKRPMHADDHAIGQTYLWLAEQSSNKHAIVPTQIHFDSILADKPTVSLEMKEEPKRPGYEGFAKIAGVGQTHSLWPSYLAENE